jgi:DNA-binding NtrC family response regulator
LAKERILVVDDQQALRSAIAQFLSGVGYEVFEAGSASEATKMVETLQPHGAIVDYSLGDDNGLTVTDRILEADPNAVVIVLTAFGSIDLAVQAIKRGAEQFLTKPVELKVLEVVLRRALTQRQATRVRHASSRGCAPNPFLGTSAAIKQLESQAHKLAASDRPILLSGETGTGKTILARWMHDNSSRSTAPFVDLNCAGFARELLESELFGYEKGAFTGAVGQKQGLLEVANRGTVFLDEIGDMEMQLQPKLLKVLEEKRIRRVGDVRDRLIDIRLIAASHRDLSRRCAENLFRSDLYFRISTLPIRLAPLRERTEDILPIALNLISNLARELGRKEVELAPSAVRALNNYQWPGNIRELKNVLERAVLLSDSEVLTDVDLAFESLAVEEPKQVAAAAAAGVDGCVTLADVERHHIQAALAVEGGHVTATARRLGIARGTLYAKLKEFQLEPHGK